MASCSRTSRWRWRPSRRRTARRRAALAAARGRPDEVSLDPLARARPQRGGVAQRGARDDRAAARAGYQRAHRGGGGRAGRSRSRPRLTALRGALHAAGVDARDFVDAGGAERGGGRRARPLRAARGRLALGHGHARGGRCRMRRRRILRQRARQPARRLRPVADRRGGGHGQEHALRSAAEPRGRAAPVRGAAADRGARRHRGQAPKPRSKKTARASPSRWRRSCSPMPRSLSIASSRAWRVRRASPDRRAALVLPAESRRWPGFLPRLLENEQDGVVIAPAGLAAVAASLQVAEAERRAAPAPARRADRGSLAGRAASNTSRRSPPRRAARCRSRTSSSAATRCGSRKSGLVIGTEEVSNTPHITLPRAAAGVSRRHCSLRREGERTMLIDHSRYGTWINGARVRERAAVRPGDRVRVGTPGVEFTLISAAAFAREAAHEKAARLRSLHAVVPRLHLLRLRRGGAVLHHRAGAGRRAGNHCASTSSPARCASSRKRCRSGRRTWCCCATRSRRPTRTRPPPRRAPCASPRSSSSDARDLGERGRDASRSASTSTSSSPTSSRWKKATSACRAARSTRARPATARKAFRGRGDRRYISALRIKGKRILVLLDTSASMMDDDVVKVIRLRNQPEAARKLAPKWRRAHRHGASG